MNNITKLESSFCLNKRAREEDDDNTVSSTVTDGSFDEDSSESDDSIDTAFRTPYDLQTILNGSVSRKISLLEKLRDVASHNNLPLLTSTNLAGAEMIAIPRQHSEANLMPPRKKMIFAIQTESATQPSVISSTSPFQCLQDMFAECDMSMTKRSYESYSGWVPWNVDGYTTELTKAIRDDDVETVRRLKQAGQNMQCSNKFGESVVHTAARRGSYKVLCYLIQEAGVSIDVCCDSGRNPLHDSCWTGQPQFDCVRLLLGTCPELLLFTDKRGFTPLEYVPKDVYPLWTSFLRNNRCILPIPN